MSAENLEKTLSALDAEIAEVEAEQRRRKDVLEKSRKQYQSLLDAVGLTDEEVQEIVNHEGFPAAAKDKYHKVMAERRRAETGEQAPEAEDAAAAPKEKKRKKRLIVKL